MLKQIEGSRAVAEAVAMCRPQVICAYPITPQTHIVEALSAMVKKEQLAAEFLNVESEFAAMSVAIGHPPPAPGPTPRPPARACCT
jgi:pyruvate ferredoxin oxidoreductase alpha subunit